MEPAIESNPLRGLGARLRQARQARGLSQEALAQPEFTKSYISAIERGNARPSLKALELLARRLDVPLDAFLREAPDDDPGTDIAALDEDLAYQLDHAKLLITTARGDEALRLISAAEQTYYPYFEAFRVETRYRFYRLRAMAYIRVGTPGSARPDLDRALVLAAQLDDPQEVERTRNVLGVVFSEQGLPQQALEHHLLCQRAIHEGTVKDPTLRIAIYGNLANDYGALKDLKPAIAAYKEALTLLEDTGNVEQQAGIYWGLSLAYKDSGDPTRATLYAHKALTLYEAVQNQASIVAMSTNLAEIYIAQQHYDQAEQLLQQAETALAQTPDTRQPGTVYLYYTLLYLGQGQVDKAAVAVQRGLELSTPAATLGAGSDAADQAQQLRIYARLLSAAGQVAERQGDHVAADRLFQQALAQVNQTEYAETWHDITLAYADVLSARGAHEQAIQYYRAAAQPRRYRPAE